MLKKINRDSLKELLATIMARRDLYAPVKEAWGVVFRQIQDPQEVCLDPVPTLLSPKGVFFPATEDMFKYRIGAGAVEAEELPLPEREAVVLGVRPPDAVSFPIMDALFLGGQAADPYWQKRREKTLVITTPFIDGPGGPEDFWSALGIKGDDERGSDIFLVPAAEVFLFKSITEKGAAFLSGLEGLQEAEAEDEELWRASLQAAGRLSPRNLSLEADKIARKFEELFGETAFWEKISAPCISCGTCTFVCPTCHCFDIADETLFGKGKRRRFWDACMFTDFTLEASGHNPRTKVYQRLRQKVCHKYSYYVRKFGMISCVGCGRCTRSCPVNIDIFSIVEAATGR